MVICYAEAMMGSKSGFSLIDLSHDVGLAVLNLIPDAVLAGDKKGRCTLANSAAAHAIGAAPETIIGRSLAELLSPAEVLLDVYKRAQRREVRDVDLELPGRDSRGATFRWNWHPIRDRSGRVVGVVGIGRDTGELGRSQAEVGALAAIASAITRASALEEILTTALDRLAGVLDLGAAGILLFDEVTQELHLAAYRGDLPAESAIGSRVKLEESSAGDAIKNRRPIILQWGDVSEPDSIVSRMIPSDSNAGTAIAIPLEAANRPLGVLCVTFSATRIFRPEDLGILQAVADQVAVALQRAKLYDAVANERAELQAVIDSLSAGLYTVDLQGIVRSANPAAAALIGRRGDDLVGMPCRQTFNFVDEAGRRLCDWACGLARADGEPISTAVRAFLPLPDGEKRMVYWSCSPLKDGHGDLIGWLEVVQDISHAREMEEMRSSFVSAVSHELLTPLSIIKGHAESLRDATTRDNPVLLDSALTAIDEETERLRRLVANVLDVARIQAGGLQLSLAPLALPPLVEKIVRRFRGRSRRHQIETSFPEHFPLVLADRDRVESILYNLLDNAIKYSPKGGTVRVIGEVAEKEVLVRVSDWGVGIPWNEQERIFEPFYRVTGRMGPKAEGSGLGLFITKRIVDAHGGRIWVESRPGRGATFVCALPREAPAELPSVFHFSKRSEDGGQPSSEGEVGS